MRRQFKRIQVHESSSDTQESDSDEGDIRRDDLPHTGGHADVTESESQCAADSSESSESSENSTSTSVVHNLPPCVVVLQKICSPINGLRHSQKAEDEIENVKHTDFSAPSADTDISCTKQCTPCSVHLEELRIPLGEVTVNVSDIRATSTRLPSKRRQKCRPNLDRSRNSERSTPSSSSKLSSSSVRSEMFSSNYSDSDDFEIGTLQPICRSQKKVTPTPRSSQQNKRKVLKLAAPRFKSRTPVHHHQRPSQQQHHILHVDSASDSESEESQLLLSQPRNTKKVFASKVPPESDSSDFASSCVLPKSQSAKKSKRTTARRKSENSSAWDRPSTSTHRLSSKVHPPRATAKRKSDNTPLWDRPSTSTQKDSSEEEESEVSPAPNRRAYLQIQGKKSHGRGSIRKPSPEEEVVIVDSTDSDETDSEPNASSHAQASSKLLPGLRKSFKINDNTLENIRQRLGQLKSKSDLLCKTKQRSGNGELREQCDDHVDSDASTLDTRDVVQLDIHSDHTDSDSGPDATRINSCDVITSNEKASSSVVHIDSHTDDTDDEELDARAPDVQPPVSAVPRSSKPPTSTAPGVVKISSKNLQRFRQLAARSQLLSPKKTPHPSKKQPSSDDDLTDEENPLPAAQRPQKPREEISQLLNDEEMPADPLSGSSTLSEESSSSDLDIPLTQLPHRSSRYYEDAPFVRPELPLKKPLPAPLASKDKPKKVYEDIPPDSQPLFTDSDNDSDPYGVLDIETLIQSDDNNTSNGEFYARSTRYHTTDSETTQPEASSTAQRIIPEEKFRNLQESPDSDSTMSDNTNQSNGPFPVLMKPKSAETDSKRTFPDAGKPIPTLDSSRQKFPLKQGSFDSDESTFGEFPTLPQQASIPPEEAQISPQYSMDVEEQAHKHEPMEVVKTEPFVKEESQMFECDIINKLPKLENPSEDANDDDLFNQFQVPEQPAKPVTDNSMPMYNASQGFSLEDDDDDDAGGLDDSMFGNLTQSVIVIKSDSEDGGDSDIELLPVDPDCIKVEKQAVEPARSATPEEKPGQGDSWWSGSDEEEDKLFGQLDLDSLEKAATEKQTTGSDADRQESMWKPAPLVEPPSNEDFSFMYLSQVQQGTSDGPQFFKPSWYGSTSASNDRPMYPSGLNDRKPSTESSVETVVNSEFEQSEHSDATVTGIPCVRQNRTESNESNAETIVAGELDEEAHSDVTKADEDDRPHLQEQIAEKTDDIDWGCEDLPDASLWESYIEETNEESVDKPPSAERVVSPEPTPKESVRKSSAESPSSRKKIRVKNNEDSSDGHYPSTTSGDSGNDFLTLPPPRSDTGYPSTNSASDSGNNFVTLAPVKRKSTGGQKQTKHTSPPTRTGHTKFLKLSKGEKLATFGGVPRTCTKPPAEPPQQSIPSAGFYSSKSGKAKHEVTLGDVAHKKTVARRGHKSRKEPQILNLTQNISDAKKQMKERLRKAKESKKSAVSAPAPQEGVTVTSTAEHRKLKTQPTSSSSNDQLPKQTRSSPRRRSRSSRSRSESQESRSSSSSRQSSRDSHTVKDRKKATEHVTVVSEDKARKSSRYGSSGSRDSKEHRGKRKHDRQASAPDPKDRQGSAPDPKDRQGSAPDPKDRQGSAPDPKDRQDSTPDPKDRRGSAPDPKDRQGSAPDPKDRRGSAPDPKDRRGSAPDPKDRRVSAPDPKDRHASAPDPKDRRASTPDPKDRHASAPDPKDRQGSAPDPKDRRVSAPDPKDRQDSALRTVHEDKRHEVSRKRSASAPDANKDGPLSAKKWKQGVLQRWDLNDQDMAEVAEPKPAKQPSDGHKMVIAMPKTLAMSKPLTATFFSRPQVVARVEPPPPLPVPPQRSATHPQPHTITTIAKTNTEVHAPSHRAPEYHSFVAPLPRGPSTDSPQLSLDGFRDKSMPVPDTSLKYQLSLENFLRKVLKWNPHWLPEQEKMGAAPPVANMKAQLLESYDSLSDYIEIMLPLLLHETWASVYRAWKDSQNARSFIQHQLIPVRVDLHPPSNGSNSTPTILTMELSCQGLVPPAQISAGKCVKEGDLVILTFTVPTLRDVPPQQKQSFGYVKKVTRTQCRRIRASGVSVHPVLLEQVQKGNRSNETLLGVVVYLRQNPISDQQFVSLQVASSLVSIVRQVSGLTSLRHSLLARDLLRPVNMHVFGAVQVTKDKAYEKLLQRFNDSQARAVCAATNAALEAPAQPRICLLQGPPGTGKSTTIVQIVNKIISDGRRRNQKPRILLCAPSNGGIDELVRRLIQQDRETRERIEFVRVGNPNSMHPDVAKFSLVEKLKICIQQEQEKQLAKSLGSVQTALDGLKKKICALQTEEKRLISAKKPDLAAKVKMELAAQEKRKDRLVQQHQVTSNKVEQSVKEQAVKRDLLRRVDVVCATLNGCGQTTLVEALRPASTGGRSAPPHFTCVIVDEAAQCVELDCLIPLQYGCSKLLLVGDPHQLPATVLSQEAADRYFGQSLFERLYDHFKLSQQNPVMLLDTQYRMHPEISVFPSKHVYDGLVKTDPAIAKRRSNFPFKSYVVFDLAYGTEQQQAAGSVANPAEAEFVVNLCRHLEAKVPQTHMGVVTPYQKQKNLLKDLLSRSKLQDVEVNTVDGFQGREKDAIIMSCVRAQSSAGTIGFVADRRRMNVALTRAKYGMYVVGNLHSLKVNGDWRALVDDAHKRRLVVKVERSREAVSKIVAGLNH